MYYIICNTFYPEWVIKYKKKGTYVNFVKGKYYLYATHSERIPATKKVKRICDAYLGRITEEDGLIPPKDKVEGTVTVLEYGLSSIILSVCENIHKGLRKTFTKNGDFVMVASILLFIYNNYDDNHFRYSYLSILFPDLNFKIPATEEQVSGIERGLKMITDKMIGTFGADFQNISNNFRNLFKVSINGKFYLSKESSEIKSLIQKFDIKLED